MVLYAFANENNLKKGDKLIFTFFKPPCFTKVKIMHRDVGHQCCT